MTNTFVIAGALALIATGCSKEGETRIDPKVVATELATAKPTSESTRVAAPTRKLFLDVHELGKGKVTAKAVAEAHEKDLAVERKYGVDLKAYWLDENEGKIYCLADAPSAEAINAMHGEAHGLLANQIMEVTADNGTWVTTRGRKLFLDVHHLGAGKVTALDAAGAHQKDLATQAKYDVKYLNYWLDEASGTIMCLSEAPSAQAAILVHKEAHGLIPDSIEEVSEGR